MVTIFRHQRKKEQLPLGFLITSKQANNTCILTQNLCLSYSVSSRSTNAVVVVVNNIALLQIVEFTKRKKKNHQCGNVLINKKYSRTVTVVIAAFITQIDDGKSIQTDEIVSLRHQLACTSFIVLWFHRCMCVCMCFFYSHNGGTNYVGFSIPFCFILLCFLSDGWLSSSSSFSFFFSFFLSIFLFGKVPC